MEDKLDKLIELLTEMNDHLSELVGAVESVSEAIENVDISGLEE